MLVMKGLAYHHSGLPPDDRLLVEQLYIQGHIHGNLLCLHTLDIQLSPNLTYCLTSPHCECCMYHISALLDLHTSPRGESAGASR